MDIVSKYFSFKKKNVEGIAKLKNNVTKRYINKNGTVRVKL